MPEHREAAQRPRRFLRAAALAALFAVLAACSPKATSEGEPAPAPSALAAPEETAPAAPASSESGSAAKAIAAVALAASTEDDVAALEKAIAELGSAELLSQAEASLVAALAEATASGRPAPGLHLALAAVYGRKGLAEKAYAAVLAAEAAAKAPGVGFSLAAIHGRKALLAPASATGAFSIAVSCEFPGALASIDGNAPIAAPARFEALRPGNHEVSVTLSGYEPFVSVVAGKDGDSISVSAALEPSPVPLTVTTEPTGASVLVDGYVVGQSPWSGFAAPGTHRVSATMRGRAEASLTLSVGVGDPSRTAELTLSPLPAKVTVVSEPVGEAVQIWLDGAFIGAAPVTVMIDEPGTHAVKSTSGPESYGPSPAVSFEAAPGEATVVTVRPSALFGYLYIAGEGIDGAYLSVDGLYVGQLPKANTIPLSLEPHKVELQKKGFKTLVKTVNITEAGVSNRVQVKMIADDSVAAVPAHAPPHAVTKRTIKVDGLVDDWEGIEPVCTDRAGDDRLSQEPGTDVSAVYLASDDKYVYARIDLADGNRRSKAREASCYTVRLAGDPVSPGVVVTVNLDVFYDVEGGAWKTQIWLKNMTELGVDQGDYRDLGATFQFKLGDGSVEMRVARSAIQRFFKTAGPFLVWGQYHVWEKWGATGDDSERSRFTVGW